MNILYEVTPRAMASGKSSRTAGWFSRMTWNPKSRTDCCSTSSRSRLMAWGSRSLVWSWSTKPSRVVSPACAAAMGPCRQSSYSGPRWMWQSIAPGRTYLPVTSMARAAGGSVFSGPSATIFSPRIAMLASSTSVAVTTRPPWTMVSTRVIVACLRRGLCSRRRAPAAERPAREDPGMSTVVDDDLAVDDHVVDADGKLLRLAPRGRRLHPVRVEDDDVRLEAVA